MTTVYKNIAFVTGGNRGIGKVLVETLLERGASKVYAGARKTETLADLVAQYGDRLVPVALDVTDPEAVAAAAVAAGDVGIVINNAGAAANPDYFGDSLEGARLEFEVNYWGSLNMIRAFAPILKRNGGGALINISSIAGLVNFPMLPSYSDSKSAVHSLTTGCRILLAEQETQVVGVYPGPVDTDMAKDLEMDKATPQSVANAILDGLEAGKSDIFPDSMAEGFAGPYEAGAKTLEKVIVDMITQPEA
jgi:NAD(P)-dependent dehydrogenase (short-subunit alcohol dehydrogenase family)